MKTQLTRIGNLYALLIDDYTVEHYQFDEGVEIELVAKGLLIKSIHHSSRQGWEEQFQAAIAAGELPEGELLEDFPNNFDSKEWTW